MLTIDAPSPRLRREGFGEKQRRAQVHGELPVEAHRIERADLVALERRGVVDQQSQLTDRRHGVGYQPREGRGV